MKKILKYNNFLYIAVHIFIGIDTFNRLQGDTKRLLIFGSIFLIIALNNYIRFKYFNGDKYFLSMLIYMTLSALLIYNVSGYSDIFSFMIIYELILFTEGPRSKIFIILAISNFLFLNIFRYFTLNELFSMRFWEENTLDILMSIIFVGTYSLVLASYKALRKEKHKVDKLNKELGESYNKLIEQSKKLEELTIEKERTRVAGEIHDSLGHSLIALSMNLDVAEKIIGDDIDKTVELISKSRDLTEESMANLRKAVYTLKEEADLPLVTRLEDTINNIESTGIVDIDLNLDGDIENLPIKHKNIVYNSVKEMITNSIRHGEASRIGIRIEVKANKLKVEVEDNGRGCSNLIKGNGLLGIESKISEMNGELFYKNLEEGFYIEIKALI